MMDKARTESSVGKVNPKFQQLADDFGFNIVPCVRARLNTKAKVENPMRIIDEIMSYNGLLDREIYIQSLLILLVKILLLKLLIITYMFIMAQN